jgi:hypothetical protein
VVRLEDDLAFPNFAHGFPTLPHSDPVPRIAPVKPFTPWEGFACTIYSTDGEATMATAAERMRAHRERARRGLRRLTIDMSEDDLRAIAKRGYEGAVTTGHISRRKRSACFSPTRFCKSHRVNPPLQRHRWPRHLA